MKSSPSFWIVCLITIGVIIVKTGDSNFGKNGNYGVIDWDNFGYYLYLPATFIYDDLKLQNEQWIIDAQKQYELSSSLYQVHLLENGNRVVQYSSGMAIFYSPAFFCGHIIAKISAYPANGFSKPYQIAILIQSFLLVFLGLFYLRKAALLFFKEKLASLLIVIICLGTNFFQIASANVSSPHVYLFAACATVIYFTIKWHQSPRIIYSFIIGFIIALMGLSRPNELLLLIVPIFWLEGLFPKLRDKVKFLLSNSKHLIALFFPFSLGLIQVFYWHHVSGEWVYDSYKNENFKLLNPYLFEFLFSYKKGWLLYTPVMIVGLIGFIPFLMANRKIATPIGVFLLVNIWILSSWDCWWYADSFSQRSIVQAYPLLIFPFGYLIKFIVEQKRILQISFYTVILILTAFNLFQTYQFSKYIIHPNGMTEAYYWNVFGVVNPEEVDRSLVEMDRNIHYLPEEPVKKQKIIFYENFSEKENQGTTNINGLKFKSEGSLILSPENRSSPKIRFAYKDIADSSYCYVICRMRFKSNYEANENNFGIEFTNVDSYNNTIYEYRYRGVENISWFEKGSWSSMDIVVIPAYLRNKEDSIQANVYLFGEFPVEIDNFSIEVLDPSHFPELESKSFFNDYHTITKGNWTKPTQLLGEKGIETIDSINQYSSTLECSIADLGDRRNIELSTSVNLEHNYASTYAVISVNDENGKHVYYESKQILKKKDDWQKEVAQFTLPDKLEINYTLRAYIWNNEGGTTLIRNLGLTFY